VGLGRYADEFINFLTMKNGWIVIAFALCVASLSEGKSANLVLLTDAPGQSVRESDWILLPYWAQKLILFLFTFPP
jgi:hypothetical protein